MSTSIYGVVYRITNHSNGKVYIGQTIQPPHTRWEQHQKTKHKLDTHLSRALRRYPEECCLFEVIEEAFSKDDLNDKESKHILEHDSIASGYNILESASGSHSELAMAKRTDRAREKMGYKPGVAMARVLARRAARPNRKFREFRRSKKNVYMIVDNRGREHIVKDPDLNDFCSNTVQCGVRTVMRDIENGGKIKFRGKYFGWKISLLENN